MKPPLFINNNESYQLEQSKTEGEEHSNKKARPLIECWICKENHYARKCSHKGGIINNTQESSIGISIPRIYEALDGGQADHQP